MPLPFFPARTTGGGGSVSDRLDVGMMGAPADSATEGRVGTGRGITDAMMIGESVSRGESRVALLSGCPIENDLMLWFSDESCCGPIDDPSSESAIDPESWPAKHEVSMPMR